MTAQIVLDDGTPTTGSKDSGTLTAITVSNFSDTGVLGWYWELFDRPIGSSAVMADPYESEGSFTPDVRGTYGVRLRTYSDASRETLDDADEQLYAIRLEAPYEWRIPAAGETNQLDTSRGWATAVETALRETAEALGAFGGGGGSGDVVGPASATDNALVRFNLTTGKLVQNSLVTVSDVGSISLPALQTVDGRDLSVDGAKLDGIEALADVTDAANVAAAGAVMTTRTISTTGPLAGGGDLSANRTLSIPAATSGTPGYATAAQITKLDGIEALADVTDATNVAAAGAVMTASLNSQLVYDSGPDITQDATGGQRTTRGAGSTDDHVVWLEDDAVHAGAYDVLIITKEPASASPGDGIHIIMGANANGNAIEIGHAHATQAALAITASGGAPAIEVTDGEVEVTESVQIGTGGGTGTLRLFEVAAAPGSYAGAGSVYTKAIDVSNGLFAKTDDGTEHCLSAGAPKVATLAGTSASLADLDSGFSYMCTNAATITITVNCTSLTPGTEVEFIQMAAGQVQLATAGGTALIFDDAAFYARTAALKSSIFIKVLSTTQARVCGDLELV